MPKKYLHKINELLENQDSVTLQQIKITIPPKVSGFYWIYTDKRINDFEKVNPPKNPKHIDLQFLAKIHKKLPLVIKESDDFWCIYNGKGKDLKSRIVAEFSDTQGDTGTLALERAFEASYFRIKYIICDSRNSVPNSLAVEYSELTNHLERIWRLSNGWPIFCKT